ncbi:cytochrome P450 [Paxillus ammoniavirescens]|nr:cytochrome P450 [Paxillus ammoniavirescens]
METTRGGNTVTIKGIRRDVASDHGPIMISTWLLDNTQYAAIVSGLFVFSALYVGQRRSHQYPPGPKGVPLFGNALQVPKEDPWIVYTEWARVYGDIMYARLFKQNMIIVNSEDVAKELFVQRSRNYSDRTVSPITEPVGLGFSTARLPYGPRWRLHRSIYNRVLHAGVAVGYRPMQLAKARRLLLDFLETPDRYHPCLQKYSASVVLSIAYDWEVSEKDDPLMNRIASTMALVLKTISPMNALFLTTFPFLLYVPKWLPGSSLRRNVEISREYIGKMADEPFEYVVRNLEDGKIGQSMVSDSLRKLDGENADPEVLLAIKHASATAFGAGTDTTSATLLIFILAMVLHPQVQANAQQEIDSVVGSERLPNFADRSSLPYVEAVLRETLRWHPVAPLGISHAALDNDIYRGYFIPKGMTVVPNVWAMTRNENKYPNASDFVPERFIDAAGGLNADTVDFIWGFGRRICAGRHVADASLWAGIASILATFKLLPAQGPDGEDVMFEPQWINGLTSHPAPFPCRIVPRVRGMNVEALTRLIRSSTVDET